MATQDIMVEEAQDLIDDWSPRALNFLDTLESLLTVDFSGPNDNSSSWSFSTNSNEFLSILQNPPVTPNVAYLDTPNPGNAPEITSTDFVSAPVPSFSAADVGDAPSLLAGSAADASFPEITAESPSISFPSAPTTTELAVPSAPGVSSVAVPTKPTLALPTAPEISAIAIPDVPSYSFPSFTEEFPRPDNLVDPTDQFSYSEAEINDDVINKIRSLSLDNMNGLGDIYGIDTDEEQALVNRAVDRERRTAESEFNEVTRRFASLGHSLPPGALAEEIDKISDNVSRRVADAEREVAINRAVLKRDARQFAITQGLAASTALLSQQGFRLERVLNASRFAAEFGITVLNAQIAKYNVQLKAYEVYANVYESKVRTVVAQLEAYRAEIEASKLNVEIQRERTAIYEAQVRAVNVLVDLYRTEMEAAKVAADIEQLKIQEYRNRVDAYVAQLRGQELRFNAYEAQIRGETAKVDLYRAQVEAYEGTVRAAATRIDANVKRAQIDVDKDRLSLDKYNAQIEAYKAKIAAHDLELRTADINYRQNSKAIDTAIEKNKLEIARYASEIESFRAKVDEEAKRIGFYTQQFGMQTDVYRALVGAWGDYYKFGVAEATAIREREISRERLQIEGYRLDLQRLVEGAKIRFDAAKAGSDISGAVLAGATSIMNALISKEEA